MMLDNEYMVLIASNVVHALCFASLWAMVGAVGFFGVPRTHQRGRLTLLGAGLLGAGLSLGGPMLSGMFSAVILPVIDVENFILVHTMLGAAISAMWLAPYGLLIYGLWRVARGLAAAVGDG